MIRRGVWDAVGTVDKVEDAAAKEDVPESVVMFGAWLLWNEVGVVFQACVT
jgi:hypothetical protein